jgi:hypothetical protein
VAGPLALAHWPAPNRQLPEKLYRFAPMARILHERAVQYLSPQEGASMERHKGQGMGFGGRLVVGLMLVIAGGALLLQQQGRLEVREFWSYSPLLLIGLGIVGIVGSRGDDRWGGYWLVVAGLYLGAIAWNWFGLHWGNAWPILVIAVGVMLMFKRSNGCGPRPTLGSDRAANPDRSPNV